MNRTVWISILFLLGSFSLQAQNKRFYLGLNAGNVSKGLPGISASTGPGYQFGADIQLGKRRLYVQPGLQYAVTSIALSHPSLSDPKSDLRVSGVKIPVMLGIKKIVAPSANVRFFTGPSFMAVTNVKHKNMNDTTVVLTDKNYHDVEWSWHLGTGIDVSRFFIDLGFQKGLTYVFTGGSNARSNLFYLNVGVRL